jgi:hypothetical protein
MLGHDRRELAAIFVGGVLGTVAEPHWRRSPRPITDASASMAVDSSTRQPCAAA